MLKLSHRVSFDKYFFIAYQKFIKGFYRHGCMEEGSKKRTKGVRVSKQKILKEDQACCIVIACGHPSADGKMSVEMTYEGDPILASYLLESAPGFIDQDEEGIPH